MSAGRRTDESRQRDLEHAEQTESHYKDQSRHGDNELDTLKLTTPARSGEGCKGCQQHEH